MGVFVKIILVIFVMTVILLFLQFFIAGLVGKANPFHLFKNMLPAYQEYLEELKNRSELRMLFSLTKGATKEDVEKAVRIIEALKKDE